MISQIQKIKHVAEEIRVMAIQNAELAQALEEHAEEILDIKPKLQEPRSLSISEIPIIFGAFNYTEIGNGRIRIDSNWQNINIKLLHMYDQKIWIHRLMIPQIGYVIAKLYAEDLHDELDLQGGGGFCARHQNWKESTPLSLHAYGVAIDLNPNKYPYGDDKQPHPRLIEIFKEGGMFWGGDFKTVNDNMHFQFSHFIK